METKLENNFELGLHKDVFNRSLVEIVLELTKIIRGFFVRMRFNKCGKYFRAEEKIRILKKNSYISVGRKVQFHREVKLSAWGDKQQSRIIIGDNTSIGDRTEIHAGSKIEIGNGCNIAWDVCIMDRDYHKFNSDAENISPVKIEDNVWIGCNSIVLKGVTIGEGAVIAAGSIVTQNVPTNCLAAGNPAKIIKQDVFWAP